MTLYLDECTFTFFFFNDTATPEIYPLSLHDALPILCVNDLSEKFELSGPTISHHLKVLREAGLVDSDRRGTWVYYRLIPARSEEHTSELQSRQYLVCRLLLEKKTRITRRTTNQSYRS